jgi:hypothetical protein
MYTESPECGKVYIGQTGHSVDTRLKEHQLHIRLEHPDKSVMSEHCIASTWDTTFNFTVPQTLSLRPSTWTASLGRPLRLSSIPSILWRVSPCAGTVEARSLESGPQQKENELLCKARNSRKSSHVSLVATQHRGKHISAAVSRHATIAATFSEQSALTNSTRCCVLRV